MKISNKIQELQIIAEKLCTKILENKPLLIGVYIEAPATCHFWQVFINYSFGNDPEVVNSYLRDENDVTISGMGDSLSQALSSLERDMKNLLEKDFSKLKRKYEINNQIKSLKKELSELNS